MTELDIARELLADKIGDTSEIELHLFEYCNLSCSFCGQDHDSKEGMNTIVEKSLQVIDFIKNSAVSSHVVNIMGGEIFNDLIGQETFDDYFTFYQKIRDYCDANNQQVRFNFVTNLIFTTNRPRVERLLAYTQNTFLSTSYDFSGRGLDINKMIVFKKNLKYFEYRINTVGFVMTRSAIRRLIGDKDKFFKEVLYPHFPIYFDWYVPEANADKMLPTEQELLDMMRFVGKNYPKVQPIQALIENEENELSCRSMHKTTILPNGHEVACRYLTYEPEQFETPIDVSHNGGIIMAHIERNDCFSCEYYRRCTMRCFVQADWTELERLDTCFIKTFFDEIGAPRRVY